MANSIAGENDGESAVDWQSQSRFTSLAEWLALAERLAGIRHTPGQTAPERKANSIV
jgi:hypothetical protein